MLGRVKLCISIPVLFNNWGFLVPGAVMDELKKFDVEFKESFKVV